MKVLKLIVIVLLLIGCKNEKNSSVDKDNFGAIEQDLAINKQDLIVIDQDYIKALKIASLEDKFIFIDFYTKWCAPCKVLDKLIFQNDSIKQILRKDFILLKYNAENDSIFHLSKKHHIRTYPTTIVLNKNGYVLNQKSGFRGENFQTLSKSVLEFTNESVSLGKENKTIKGYSNKIDASKYPKFYIDYMDRTNTKIKLSELNEYLNTHQDVFSEEYFSVLWFFGDRRVSNSIANKALKNKNKYLELYGKLDVDRAMYYLASGKFNQAILEKSQIKFDDAITYVKNALDGDSKEWAESTISYYKKDFLKTQNKWGEVFEINKNLKDKGEFDNGSINHFSWQIYEDCDDQKVIKKCLEWMKEVTNEEPIYIYLDTYANLIHKSGNKKEARKIALLAIEAAKKEGKSTKELEILINKL